jgi:hypothetical protein
LAKYLISPIMGKRNGYNVPSRMKLVRSLAICLAIGVACTGVTLFAGTSVRAYVWHVRHGDSTTFAQWRVPIPKGYFEAGASSFFKHSFGSPIWKAAPWGHISLFHHSQPAPGSYDRIEAATIRVAAEDGYQLQARRSVQSTSDNSYCFEFSRKSNTSLVAIRCMTDSAELAVYFEGDRRFSNDVYGVVRGLERLPSK